MIRLTLRTLRADLARLLMSTLAVVLGVAFIAGTLIFVDGMRAGTYERAATFDRHTDVGVYLDTEADRNLIDSALVEKVRAVEGVRAAAAELVGTAGVVGSDGRPVLGFGVLAAVPVDPALQSYQVVAGRMPQRAGEAVLDERTVQEQGFALGTEVRVGGASGAARPYTLVGVVDVAGTSRDIGGPFIGLVGPDALAVTEQPGYHRILVAAEPGVTDEVLAGRIAQVTVAGTTVHTRTEILDAAVEDAVRDVNQFNMVLIVFAAVAVLVAAFVIANTFTIVLAQRTRRTALLRLVGATRGQVFRATLLESAVIGLLASAVGVLVGIGLAAALGVLMDQLNVPLDGDLTVTAPTVLSCLVIGTVLTVGSALVPAWQGTRVAPVAALTDAALQVTRSAGRLRLIFGGLVLAAGVAALAGAGGTGQIVLVALGGMLSFFGIVLFGPVLVPALVRMFGVVVRRVLGVTAALAVANAVRNPRRVAATATALVIGIGLVSSFVVGAHSTKAAIDRSVDAQIGVDFVVTGIGGDLPAGVVEALAVRPELGVVHEQRSRIVDDSRIRAAHPALVGRQVQTVVAGQVDSFGPGRVLVHRELAAEEGWSPGDRIDLRGHSFEVAAVIVGPEVAEGPVSPGRVVELVGADFTRLFPDERGYLAEIEPAQGVSPESAREAIEAVLADYPTVNLLDQAAYKRMLTSTVDMLLAFVVALLGLAVVIALVGVANTLSLSVLERTRENAVLRAVGLTRPRMRAMLAVEAVLTALVGALLGVALGTAVTGSVMAILARFSGDFVLAVPWGQLGGILAAAVLAALAASVLPARRALRRPVVEALADR
ncbi:ABC transporter permease [Micromonospora sp. DT229]|uniref:ABC transporter permease n=1 Tax=Micromonospora sp. DT229 TaxID=3393430 RepID=UPI003CE97D15